MTGEHRTQRHGVDHDVVWAFTDVFPVRLSTTEG